ncbi:hypothetical protein HXX76_001973 [Chlamydomonas incerta]|uniref:Ricin B lectin domain-containing protein n=1 Tax=Chlamydomonas incerta TaxID=51695 RepID=A0A835WA68_CHLIN|nr:hypothetical protein HXX76_001973 [Chlamydomonas incerta]|eukprot:KAG2443623.1 hypothetical protein HXX76_001973 [Chlamydomonas incerta]
MFSCDVRDIGVASASRYYTQVFGCPSGQTCNSCGSSNIVTTNCPAVNGFTASANTDFNGNDIRQAGTTTATAAAACAANPWCRGFNSNGWIKHSLPSQSTVQGLCFYRRNVQPGGPAHGMTVSIGTGTNRQGCIDVPWNNKAAGVVLHQWECNGGSAQRWYLEHAGNGWYRVKATSSLCMGVRESRTTSGTDVLLWGCSNINDQLFAFVWNSARGAYTMRPAHASSMCVDISSSSTANGARVQIWTCNDSAAQMFSLAP